MSTAIRLEHIGNTSIKTVVEVWEDRGGHPRDILRETITLDKPAQLIEQRVSPTRYLVIRQGRVFRDPVEG